jgi:molybdenum cofactor cytidylyltransferase|tara:strand:+ start:71 stop:670 length:600 start_codon:yes stop_codon:yes gene_type:complete
VKRSALQRPALADDRKGGAVLLAAGFGRRFGSDKRLHPFPDGRPMVLATAKLYRAAFDRLIVVIREDDPIAGLLGDYETLTCADATQGMGHTLAAGALAARGWDYVFVALADMPWIRPETLGLLRDDITHRSSTAIVRPVYRGTPGHPVGFAARHIATLTRCQGDEGARSVVRRHLPDVVELDVDDAGVLRDLDLPPPP